MKLARLCPAVLFTWNWSRTFVKHLEILPEVLVRTVIILPPSKLREVHYSKVGSSSYATGLVKSHILQLRSSLSQSLHFLVMKFTYFISEIQFVLFCLLFWILKGYCEYPNSEMYHLVSFFMGTQVCCHYKFMWCPNLKFCWNSLETL
jgi:hypothetical protein